MIFIVIPNFSESYSSHRAQINKDYDQATREWKGRKSGITHDIRVKPSRGGEHSEWNKKLLSKIRKRKSQVEPSDQVEAVSKSPTHKEFKRIHKGIRKYKGLVPTQSEPGIVTAAHQSSKNTPPRKHRATSFAGLGLAGKERRKGSKKAARIALAWSKLQGKKSKVRLP